MQPFATALHHASREIDVLRHYGLVFILAEKLATDVSFDDLFIIRCEALDLTVATAAIQQARLAFRKFRRHMTRERGSIRLRKFPQCLLLRCRETEQRSFRVRRRRRRQTTLRPRVSSRA